MANESQPGCFKWHCEDGCMAEAPPQGSPNEGEVNTRQTQGWAHTWGAATRGWAHGQNAATQGQSQTRGTPMRVSVNMPQYHKATQLKVWWPYWRAVPLATLKGIYHGILGKTGWEEDHRAEEGLQGQQEQGSGHRRWQQNTPGCWKNQLGSTTITKQPCTFTHIPSFHPAVERSFHFVLRPIKSSTVLGIWTMDLFRSGSILPVAVVQYSCCVLSGRQVRWAYGVVGSTHMRTKKLE